MAVDLKIEAFSIDLFRIMWYYTGVKSFIPPRYQKYDNVSDEMTCSDAVIHALMCRRGLFRTFFANEIFLNYEDYSKSVFDFYLYILNTMDTFLAYKDMNVFDKLFMICTAIVEMGYTCSVMSISMFSYNCPRCFALYFDYKYKEEFYAEGGWGALERRANAYQARVLTYPECYDLSCAMTEYKKAILADYSIDLVKRTFKEKCIDKKTCCLQCLPLFHAIRHLFDASESVTEYKLTEGYLQLILRMLSHKELLEEEKRFFQGTNLEKVEETLVNTQLNTNVEQKSDESLLGDAFCESLSEFKKQNTRLFLARLFKAHDFDDDDNQCMFCSRNVNQLLEASNSVSDVRVERIKSAICDTMNQDRKTPTILKESASDIDTKGVLKIFFALGVEPLMSDILRSLKNSQHSNNVEILADSLAKMNIPKAPDGQSKTKHRKSKTKHRQSKTEEK